MIRRITVALILMAGIAHADPKSDALFDEGRKLMDAKDYKGACEKFDQAIAVDPTAAGTMLNLGLCNEELHKYATALRWFRKAANAAAEATPRLTQHEEVAKKHTGDLATKVAWVTIQVDGEVPNQTKVKIDRVDVPHDEWLRAEVDPGHHVLDVGAAGMKNVHKEFEVEEKPGQGPTLSVKLEAGSNAIVIDRGKTRRKIAIATAIGGGALWIASAGVGLYANSQYCKYAQAPAGGDCSLFGKSGNFTLKYPYTDAKPANDAINLAKYWGTGLFVAGAAAIGIASYLYFTAPQPEKIDQTVFVPTLDRNGGGIAISGKF